MGGDGGDGGYEAKQADLEAKKARARSALNAQFGVGDPTTVDRSLFVTKQAQPGQWVATGRGDVDGGEGYMTEATPEVFDQAGYDAATAGAKTNAASRDSLYQTVRDNSFNAGKRRLDEQRDDASRKLKFELFAKGLNGGSEDVDQNAQLGRTYNQGIIDLGAKADAAKAQFRGDDENTRLQLLQSVDNGMDQGSALSSAIAQQQVNADRAAADANGTDLGDLFANAGLLYTQSQAAKGKQAGQDWWNQYRTGGSRGGAGAATGTVYNGPGV